MCGVPCGGRTETLVERHEATAAAADGTAHERTDHRDGEAGGCERAGGHLGAVHHDVAPERLVGEAAGAMANAMRAGVASVGEVASGLHLAKMLPMLVFLITARH